MRNRIFLFVFVPFLVFSLTGCAVIFQKGRRSDLERIQELEKELAELRRTRGILEERLASEINNDQVSVHMGKRGLVITFVAEVLFDSGKADLKAASLSTLDKISSILQEEVPNNNIGIEGHTDNQPIKHSRWKSNWELSAHRALSVLYYLRDSGINPEKLSATGYGEYHPVASNDSTSGRQKNRRVEIIIIPQHSEKAKEDSAAQYGYDDEELK